MSVRLPGPTFLFLCLATAAWSDGFDELSASGLIESYTDTSDYRFGGAARQPALLPDIPSDTAGTALRLSLPRPFRNAGETRREARVGDVTLFFDEGWDAGRDAFHLGTAMTLGAATAGLSMTYLDTDATLSRSELYLDYALSKRLSVGLSGILGADATGSDAPVPQFGVNAEYRAGGSAYLQGGVSDAPEAEPIFGLSVGLRF